MALLGEALTEFILWKHPYFVLSALKAENVI